MTSLLSSFERASIALRHSKLLERSRGLWNLARPVYNGVLSIWGHGGLVRNINQSDLVTVHPSCRAVPESCEPLVWNTLMNSLRAGDRVVEVGGFIGLYSVAIARRIQPFGVVYTFEPDAHNRRWLNEHRRLNSVERNLVIVPAAVAALDGLVSFESRADSESRLALAQSAETEQTLCVRLDTIFPQSRIDVLKIDVEGFEEHVLRGAKNLLEDSPRRPRTILIEVHPYVWESVGTTAASLMNLLVSCGYRIASPTGEPITAIESYGHIFAHAVEQR